MLKDVIDFIMARTSYSRSDSVREINYAWKELYAADDLPDSVQEISVTPIDSNARLSLPWYVSEMRGVKQNYGYGRIRIDLNTPRVFYQNEQYVQSPFTWRILGTSPLKKSITNATTVTATFTTPVVARTIVTLMGPDDNGAEVRDQLVFEIGDTTKESVKRFTDFNTITKDIITETDLRILNSDAEEIALVPNSQFEARNTVVQITDKCFVVCNYCRCFDILYKRPAPYLYFDETYVPNQEVLMAKTMEWIVLPKDGGEEKAGLYAEKSRSLLNEFNGNSRGVENKMDVGVNLFNKRYSGNL